MRKGKVWAFEAIFLNKIEPPEEKTPQKKRVKVELKIHVRMWLNSKKKKKEKMEPKKKKTIQKRNQNLSMARKKLTKKNLKTNSYLMMKEFNNGRK